MTRQSLSSVHSFQQNISKVTNGKNEGHYRVKTVDTRFLRIPDHRERPFRFIVTADSGGT